MIKAVVISAVVLACSPYAHASASLATADLAKSIASAQSQTRDVANWNVGDTMNFQISTEDAGVVGTEVQTVESGDADNAWLKYTFTISGQVQVYETLIRKKDGMTIEYKVNGQDQPVPADSYSLDNQTYDDVTVPLGQFHNAIHDYLHDSQQNVEIWFTSDPTVLGGVLKTLTTFQGMRLDIELASFSHGG